MSLAQPWILLGWLLVPILAVAMHSGDRRAATRLRKIVAPRLLPSVSSPADRRKRTILRGLFLTSVACFVFAAAQPQWGELSAKIDNRGREVMICVDVSKSMLARDVTPSRLERAKIAVEDLLNALPGDRFGLIAFAGEAQVETPITNDAQDVLDSLEQIDTHTVALGGTDLAAAVRTAAFALGKSDAASKAIVIFSDGEEFDEEGRSAAANARDQGFRVFAVGVGLETPTELYSSEGVPVRDADGKIVKTSLEPSVLKGIAESGDGVYCHLDGGTIPQLQAGIQRLNQTSRSFEGFRQKIERYQWPLSMGLVALVLFHVGRSWRPRLPVAVLLLTVLGVANKSAADDPLRSYLRGDYQAAADSWKAEIAQAPADPIKNFNAGTAFFKLRRYGEAVESFSKTLRSPDTTLREQAYYNGGNALLKQGDAEPNQGEQINHYRDSIYFYQQALELDPQDGDAFKNLEIAKQRLKKAKERQGTAQKTAKDQSKQSGKPNRSKNSPNRTPSNGEKSDDADPHLGDQQSSSGQGQRPREREENDAWPSPTKTPKLPEDKMQEIDPSDPTSTPGPPSGGESQAMLPSQAKALLDSLRSEEDHVDLHRRKVERTVLKDW